MCKFLRRKRTQKPVWKPEKPITTIIEGRRYRVDTPYLLPQDGQEINRLDFQHYALRAALGSDYKAPLESATTRMILDVGCGTGKWARERAEEFPHAHVTGIDIESHLPSIPLPKNLQFMQADVLHGLPFPNASFDFVHQRLLVGAIPALRWSTAIQELARVTQANGWIEMLESGITYLNAGAATEQFQSWWLKGEKQLGFSLELMPHLDRMLSNVGLKRVHAETLQLPLGKWGGRAGDMLAKDMHAIFTSFRAVYVSRFGIPAAQFEKALAALPDEWERHHTCYEFYLVYGQK